MKTRKEFRVGDKVYDWFRMEKGIVTWNGDSGNYRVSVEFENGGTEYYTLDGRILKEHKYPALLYKKFVPIIPQIYRETIGHPYLKVDDKVVVWENDGIKEKRHFAEWGEDGRIVCFAYGMTSFTTDSTYLWDNYEIIED